MKKLLPLLLCSVPFFCSSQTLESTTVKQVDSLVAVSNSLWRAKKHADAEPIALQAKELTLTKLGSENATYAACLHNLGLLYFSWGGDSFGKCILYWEEALAIRERVLGKLHPDYAKTLNNVGAYYRGIDNAKAEKILLEALEIKEITSGKESIEYSKALYNLAQLYLIVNKPDEALDYSEKCFAIREKTSAIGGVDYVNAMNILANAYFTVGRYEEALALYNKLLEITNKNGSQHITGLCNLAALYNQMGKYEDAELLSFQAIESLEKNGEVGDLMVLSLQNYGNACAYLGRIDEAIATHEKSLLVNNISEKERARASLNLGTLALHTYRKDEAERYLLSAKNQYDKLYGKEHYEQYHITNNLGGLYNLTDRFEEAESLFREAIQISEKLAPGGEKSSVPIINIGMMYLRQGQYLMAEEYLLRALELRQKRMGQKSPKVEEALSYLQELYLVVNKLDKAITIALLSDSLRQAMIQRASGYLSDREMAALLDIHSYKNAMLLSIATISNDPKMKDAAYNNALFYKGFSLEGNLLLERAFRRADEANADIYLQWKGLQRRLANEYAKPIEEQNGLPALEIRLNEMEKQLTRELSGFGFAHEATNWLQVQSTLKPGEAAIEFYRFYHYNSGGKFESDSVQYIAMLLRPGDEHPALVPLFEEKQLAALLNTSSESEQVIFSKLYKTKDLYNLLWLQLEPLLKNTSKIWYSPDGLLHRIAFSAIPTPDGKRLGDEYQLACIGSNRQLAFPEKAIEAGNLSAAVFGGIQYDMDTMDMEKFIDIQHRQAAYGWRRGLDAPVKSWKYLPGTLVEVKETTRYLELGGYQTVSYTGERASETAFKKLGMEHPSPDILHVATHGYFFQRTDNETRSVEKIQLSNTPSFVSSPNPLVRAGLILAGANYAWNGNPPLSGKEDGTLTAYEISQLDLSSTKLVVLSACDSGLGDIEGSEGVYGLQRAFKIAGAKQLLMSLWHVPDAATKELMGLFYTYLLRDKMPTAAALQQAQRELGKKYDSPYYWAGFVLVE